MVRIIVGTLLSKNSFAQEKKEPVKKTYFSVALDSYKDTDEDVNERYGLIPGVKFGITTDISKKVGILSINIKGYKPAEVGAILDQTFDIAARPGLHCAPFAHQMLGTFPDGTVRISPGLFNTEDDINQLIKALNKIASEKI